MLAAAYANGCRLAAAAEGDGVVRFWTYRAHQRGRDGPNPGCLAAALGRSMRI